MKKTSSTFSILAIAIVLIALSPMGINAQVLNQPEAAPNPNLGTTSAWTAACASDSFNEYFVNFTWSPPLVASNNEFILELSDSNGNFGSPLELDRVTDKNTVFDFDFQFAVPTTTRGENYRMRVRSTNPAKTSPPSVAYPMHYVDFDSPLLISEDGNGTIPPGGTIQQCSGSSVTLAAHNIPNPETYQYNWYRSGTPLSEKSHEITVSTPGMYYVELDYGSVCSGSANTQSNTIEITTGSASGIAINGASTVSLCAGDPYTLVSNISGLGLTYTWYKDGSVVAGPTLEGHTFNINTSVSGFEGNYEVEIEGPSTCLERSSAVTIQNLGSLQVTRQNDADIVLLPGQNTTLSVTTTASTPTYQWYKDGTPITGETNSTLNINDTGVYFVRVTETGGPCAGAPVDSESTTVASPDSFEFVVEFVGSYGPCQNTEATLNLSTINAVSALGAKTNVTSDLESSFAYQWSYEGNTLGGETSRTLTVSDQSNNGQYVLNGVLNTYNVASNTLEVRLASDEILNIASNSTILCVGADPITINTFRALSGETFEWQRNGTVVDTSNEVLVATEVGTYQLVIRTNACPIVSNEIEIQLFDESLLVLDSPENIIIIEGETETVTASGASSYEWFDANNNLLGTLDSFSFDQEGEYLLVADFGNCSVSRVITVSFRDTFAIPNVITANGDGINDLWVLPNTFSRDPQVLVTIFDERGREVFSQFNYENNWPESTTSFSQQNMIFYYKVTKEGKSLKQGTITVIK
ncbi:gliding motility-associated C-terminal domain-containing protein [Flagellimonas allohymeniacidonis]|uniref:Gliding motility-associated C-terminal domain-containing protein n=1 Tax=Flagellimonas allohymeniacidonis TaxID=2517819 RepID=A0A4Q8QEH2_9FLAO|nr:gliding motility-associated C-terminal domain-containing protein [Allomuricauda hymeniacidonis]TAI47568.1 gliding motility-associated C-terminal domain-containing protein [Allomuricauda hymeniacidonis]